ncbi:hypothetical protein ACFQU9_03460 [Actinomadura namibiensis]|uniref:Uncharacterized protein n=1 Tax=Actinomadura namibiensis TaxID=182080 RepID=A0A7W3QRB0_ACTNM|nr:hypothetical protein [Actinomadura namibiensis]MBA8956549.1 hypothetical protein [Actinomadura namibiensis]
MRLRHELTELGARVRVRRARSGRWKLRLYWRGWSTTVMCAGAEGTYAYVTTHGQLLGPTGDVRYIARRLLWMLERHQR